MRILIAPDKFKGSLGAEAVAETIGGALGDALPGAEIKILPVADGGEGTAAATCRAHDGRTVACSAHDALGRELRASYAWLPQSSQAVMETSAAAGLALIAPNERDPLHASTFGVGEMLLDAAGRGAREVIIGLGGSATNDGGCGLARALGFRFLAANGEELKQLPEKLPELATIQLPNELQLPPIVAATDVENPLLGPRGATAVFSRQKGATEEQQLILERGLTRLADVAARTFGRDERERPGAGAAGGLGFGLVVFCNAKLLSGFEVVAEAIDLQSAIDWADVVVTGEGRLDQQTLFGKAPAGVARMARAAGKRVFAIVGALEHNPEVEALFDKIFPLNNSDLSAESTRRSLAERTRELATQLA